MIDKLQLNYLSFGQFLCVAVAAAECGGDLCLELNLHIFRLMAVVGLIVHSRFYLYAKG